MSIDSLFGVIVHGIAMSETVNNILWMIMCILFTVTINMFLYLFMHFKIKSIIINSIIFSIFY